MTYRHMTQQPLPGTCTAVPSKVNLSCLLKFIIIGAKFSAIDTRSVCHLHFLTIVVQTKRNANILSTPCKITQPSMERVEGHNLIDPSQAAPRS